MVDNSTNSKYVGKSTSEWDIEMDTSEDSENVGSFQYSSLTKTLRVHFIRKKREDGKVVEVKKVGTYQYYVVPKALVTKMMNADSVKTFLDTEIMTSYEYERV